MTSTVFLQLSEDPSNSTTPIVKYPVYRFSEQPGFFGVQSLSWRPLENGAACVGLASSQRDHHGVSLFCVKGPQSVSSPPPLLSSKRMGFLWLKQRTRAARVTNWPWTPLFNPQLGFRSCWPTSWAVVLQLNNSWELTASQLQPARARTWAPKCIKMIKWLGREFLIAARILQLGSHQEIYIYAVLSSSNHALHPTWKALPFFLTPKSAARNVKSFSSLKAPFTP